MLGFILDNRTVKVALYELSVIDDSGKLIYKKPCLTMKEAEAEIEVYPKSTVTELDNPPKWMDGIQVTGNNPWEQAVVIYEMGEEAYKASLRREQSTNPEQLRADLDYVMLMGGV